MGGALTLWLENCFLDHADSAFGVGNFFNDDDHNQNCQDFDYD
jgi:hypothetical protein